mmetsp:Transcript_12909/g.21840  ORF Transcript_12909/g.21840 Transcript_12909/m.21840 type:complete len:164 (+) Transcript_12909:178-669(+)
MKARDPKLQTQLTKTTKLNLGEEMGPKRTVGRLTHTKTSSADLRLSQPKSIAQLAKKDASRKLAGHSGQMTLDPQPSKLGGLSQRKSIASIENEKQTKEQLMSKREQLNNFLQRSRSHDKGQLLPHSKLKDLKKNEIMSITIINPSFNSDLIKFQLNQKQKQN